ncbi:pyridoxal phosphate-dependent aminotransferase [Sphaerisporangium sp. TRM90804]|uniref:pyridoxal phosphate-dependent aminotransferase n=1 Tax=Sphaerisporangium sp. TRM90804 TaxID=3031113 RepID=UPI00244779BC|nr:pyridoxal phosphate-dependent aminotransferase [Sphaerisporangium sp. TRM90804]MDH2429663.1 pyridoxal phosphate-dependent aminotransferase [Sphaerisporangium sp. TRM90804]
MAVSATLAVNEEVARRRRAGLDTVPLGFGEAGVPVHPLLSAELARWAGMAAYGPCEGVEELRVAAAGYWDRRGLATDPEQVVAGPGSKALLWALLGACGGAVALARPSWVSYAAQAALHGLPAHLVPTVPGQGGVPDPERLEVTAVRARRDGVPLGAVVLTLPDNPTGTLAEPGVVAAVCEVARAHDLLVVSDEIYRDLLHDESAAFTSPAELAPERVVLTTGPSKNLALGGWRLGVARFPATDEGRALRETVVAVGSEVWSAPAHPVQRAAALAFTEPPELRDRVRASARLHARVAEATADVFTAAGADVPRPQAGFYLYPDMTPLLGNLGITGDPAGITDTTVASTLLAGHGVATLPGSAFGDDPARLRLRIATSLLYGDDSQREQALRGDDPARLPWIAAHLDRLAEVLSGRPRA